MEYKELIISRSWYGLRFKIPYRFRYDPVPGIRRYGNCSWYRKPRTTQERRKFFDAIEQGVHVRGRRRPRSIPNSWDDLNFAHHSKRSWKRQKKRKQWM